MLECSNSNGDVPPTRTSSRTQVLFLHRFALWASPMMESSVISKDAQCLLLICTTGTSV